MRRLISTFLSILAAFLHLFSTFLPLCGGHANLASAAFICYFADAQIRKVKNSHSCGSHVGTVRHCNCVDLNQVALSCLCCANMSQSVGRKRRRYRKVESLWMGAQECVCRLPFVHVFVGVLAGLLTVALQQNVCPFLSPLM